MKRPGKTPLFRGPNGSRLPDSIAEIGYVPLGGVDQWVLMRGRQVSNPPLIVLHGGPGFSDTLFFRHFNAALESTYTMVYWDQRGAGKSFDPGLSRSTMTVEQFIADLDELVSLVRARVGHTQVVLLGHSWGSTLGVLYAARFPEKVAAYVGAAQIGDARAAEAASYAFAVSEARRLADQAALEGLRAIGPPPYSASALFQERMWVQRLVGERPAKTIWQLGRILLASEEYSIVDVPKVIKGFRFSLEALWSEASRVNLFERVPALEMPVFFFVGRRDHWVPAETSVAYFNAVTAPSKHLVWFENSGHEAFVDEPIKFNRTMIDLVRPSLNNPADHATRVA
jgi:pimeloyl-ACP methyl ester carboxylesterase